MHPTQKEREKAILVALDTGDFDVDISLEELELLADTAGIDTVGQLTQVRKSPDSGTFIGRGKVDELAEYVENLEADLIIFDHELSGTQIRNLEKATDVAVIDRTMLILDIFAQSARTAEGRLQVDLAHHKYLLPRLTGMGISLSRLAGGGAGGGGARRGKGETKLELDRRHIRRHIQNLEQQLQNMTDRRDRFRERRQKDGITTVAIVGYTNVGKSTLLNALTDAGVLVEDQLFATLDPTSRALELPDGRNVMLVDTVGLVRRLPHHLVEAFKSTLEEAVFADLLLVMADASSDELTEQIAVTKEILDDLGVQDTPVLHVLNKSDLVSDFPHIGEENVVMISAKNGFGLTQLLESMAELLPPTQKRLNLCIPYTSGHLIDEIRKDGFVHSEEYKPDGIHIDAMVDNRILHQVEPFIC